MAITVVGRDRSNEKGRPAEILGVSLSYLPFQASLIIADGRDQPLLSNRLAAEM